MNNSKLNKITGNTLIIAFTELVFMIGGMMLMKLVFMAVFPLFHAGDDARGEFIRSGLFYVLFLIPIFLCLLYMRITRPAPLSVFTKGSGGVRIRSLCTGLLIGFLANSLISLLVGLTKTVSYSWRGFSGYILLLLPLVFIQSSCEEILLRGYVPEYLEDRLDWSTVAFVSGILFIFHHYRNLEGYGYSSSFCINVFLLGVLLYLLVRVNGNFWICCGFHTAWNFTQQYLFGLPNSGNSSSIALFTGNDARDNFFYHTVYGNEGSWLTTVVVLILILLLVRKEVRSVRH